MPDIIQLLPDSVANQIAAGEVIQRPASVIKELMENAIDADSTAIKVIIKDAGKTLIQVIDNGNGMSETDARLAFERHATSKIKCAGDLAAIRTMGFRGEALSSVAAVANVELKTRQQDSDLGVCIHISGSDFTGQESCSCSKGSSFSIKNLFFNVPARRKFLKADTTELKHIITEFQRVAVPNPQIAFSLYHNDVEIFNLPPGNIRQRIINIFGKNINQNLISVHTDTSMIKIFGFVGKPEFATRTGGEQYFFVNKRYMRHPYFHKAVVKAYDKILQPEMSPSYFIFFEIDPASIDVNIHPTKTEIKFEDEQSIWKIIQVTVKESLGKFNVVPSIDFDMEKGFEIPTLKKDTQVTQPVIKINEEFNPFGKSHSDTGGSKKYPSAQERERLFNWEKLYSGFENENKTGQQTEIINADNHKSTITNQQSQINNQHFDRLNATQSTITDLSVNKENEHSQDGARFFQLKNRFILTPVKSGIMFIDQKRAHERILFEKFMTSLNDNIPVSQLTLFPATLEFTAADFELMKEISPDLRTLGFDIQIFGKNSFVVNGTPENITVSDPKEYLANLLETYREQKTELKAGIHEKIACSLAKVSAVNYGKQMGIEEMKDLVNNLFLCSVPNYSPSGKPVLFIYSVDELEKHFK